MRTVLFIPPLPKMSGGLVTLYRLAVCLHEQGREVCVSSLKDDVPGMEQVLDRGIPFLPWQSLRLGPYDLWLVPESHPNAIATGTSAGARTVVYAQSWNYTLTTLPPGVHWQQMPVAFLAASHPVAWFLEKVLGVQVLGVLPPAIAPCFFEQARANRPKPSENIRVAFMPRKNAALARQMQDVTLAVLGPRPGFAIKWLPLHNMTPEQVAVGLASSHIFLASSFPEGFGLPPAEAMAAGCLPVGFTGFGGWEYMRSALCPPSGPFAPHTSPAPPCSLPYTLEPNGLYVADGDTIGGGLALAAALHAMRHQPDSLEDLRKAASEAASLFTVVQQSERVASIWGAFESSAAARKPEC